MTEERAKFFIDTEFIEAGPYFPVTLLSIGIVCEDGRELYLESEADVSRANEWVRVNVFPHLTGQKLKLDAIAARVKAFVGSGTKPEFWGYYADYDWVVFCQIFGAMIDLPKDWPMYCRDIKQFCAEHGDPKLPAQSSTEHNALNDARWSKVAYEFLMARSEQASSPQPDEFTEKLIDDLALELVRDHEFSRKVIETDSKPYRAIVKHLTMAYRAGEQASSPATPPPQKNENGANEYCGLCFRMGSHEEGKRCPCAAEAVSQPSSPAWSPSEAIGICGHSQSTCTCPRFDASEQPSSPTPPQDSVKCTCLKEGSRHCKFPHPCGRCYQYHPGVSCYWHAQGKTPKDKRTDGRTFQLSDGRLGCDECCTGDRCDDRTHRDRENCSYCLGSNLIAAHAPSSQSLPIADALCSCGHLRSHHDIEYGCSIIIDGDGGKCACGGFISPTWHAESLPQQEETVITVNSKGSDSANPPIPYTSPEKKAGTLKKFPGQSLEAPKEGK